MRADLTNRAMRGRGEAGFVLIAVLSIMALLALMLGVASLLARGTVETSVVETSTLRARALLLAGVELAGHQLFALNRPPEAVNGQQVRLDVGTVTIFVVAEAGRVDLNGADETLLAAAYRASGLTTLAPDVFAASVVAWRNRIGGAVGTQLPIAAPFRAIGDLQFVEEVSQSDVVALSPFITVFNPAGRIDPLAAPSALLAALPGIGPNIVTDVAALSATRSVDTIFILRSAFRGLERLMILGEAIRSYSVRIEARLDNADRPRTVRAVLMVSVTSKRPYHVAYWQED